MNILDKSKIIFVCLSNTSISPIAEGFFKKMVDEDIEVTSAGIYSFNHESAEKEAIEECLKYDVDLSKHISKNIKDIEIGDNDLVLTADFKQIKKFKSLTKKENVEIYTIKEFGGNVSDLDLNKTMGFEEIIAQIIEAITNICKNQNLSLNPKFKANVKKESGSAKKSAEIKFEDKASFRYLDNLINSASRDVILDSDIKLDVDEENAYLRGINIKKENIVIDGNNHVIDACGKSSIFNIMSQNITLKNIIFKNAHSMNDGGAIKHKNGYLKVTDCKFINNFSNKKGGAISCSWKSYLQIIRCEFIDNHANESACIHNLNGNIEIAQSLFEKNRVKNNASTITNQKYANLSISKSKFLNNSAMNAGVLLNRGKCMIHDCEFANNQATISGGVINNQRDSSLMISKCDFLNNSSGSDGGAIINFSKVRIKNSNINDNYSKEHAGAISNQKGGFLEISSSQINNNRADIVAGGILNWAKCLIYDSYIENNTSKEFGGAISNQEDSRLIIDNCHFNNNENDKYGGSIFNLSSLQITNSAFSENIAKRGGAIFLAIGSNTYVQDSEFDSNHADEGSSVMANDETKLIKCTFSNHQSNDVICNTGSLLCIDNLMERNDSKNLILNDEESHLNVSGGYFKNNSVSKSAIYNLGQYCSVFKVNFENNRSVEKYCADITNEGYLFLNDVAFNAEGKTVLNRGHIDVKKMDKRGLDKIHNLNTIEEIKPPKAAEFDFNNLFNLIKKSDDLKLDHDFSVGNYELDYFEGGINLKKDNLRIDGNNHIIDGNNRTRIFLVTGKNIVLENIIFKNATLYNSFDNHSHGGGAIHVVKGSSLKLKNCTFQNSLCEGDGGAILNSGKLKIIGSEFNNNLSKSDGGAICNKNELEIVNSQFTDNSSRVGGAIYSSGNLAIKRGIKVKNNLSQFDPAIYNAGTVNAKLDDIEGLIFNSGEMNPLKNDIKTFIYLEEKIRMFDEIELTSDILFDFKKEPNLKYGIEIKKDLVINGNGYALDVMDFLVDGSNSASLFKIKRGVNVVFKNLTFKNCYSDGQSIIDNKGSLTLIDCKFLNNHATAKNSLIENTGTLKIIGSSFFNNMSKKQSLILNRSVLEIDDVDFINNNSFASGCCIINYGLLDVKDSNFKSNTTGNRAGAIYNEEGGNLNIENTVFEHNNSDVNAGTINNYGKIIIKDSKFIKNTSKNYAGAILNQSNGYMNISNTLFKQNQTKINGGCIYNYGDIDIDDSKFIENKSREKGGAIGHREPLTRIRDNYLKISNTEFIKNTDKRGNAICTKLDTVELINCKIIKV